MDLEVQGYNSTNLKVVMRPYESEHELRLFCQELRKTLGIPDKIFGDGSWFKLK